ncbi:NAD(P)/FAD-dependent oxidoreductase [Kitasatospora sp. NPDC059463]|uniref:NAD(P)/FAD-dependent oxidoreductase n=1 Tax=Kitasatospora sp. NPDC059463 TaxID=3346842 RepID=UPI0036C94EFC
MSTTPGADIAVVGAGVIGLATAERLAAHGARVVLIDDTGATGGATSASGGLVRAFDPTTTHAAWAAEGCAAYQHRGPHGTWPHLRAHGSLTLLDRDTLTTAHPALTTAHDAGHSAHVLDAHQITHHFPALRTPDHLLAVHEPHAGWLPAQDLTRALLHEATTHPPTRLLTTRATALLTRPGDTRVHGVQTTTGPVHADAVLLAAGAASTPLAATAGIHLPLTTRAVGYCLFHIEDTTHLAHLPTLVDTTTGAWLRRWDDDHTVLAGVTSTRTGIPPTVRHHVTPAEEHRIRTVVRERFPPLAHARAVGGVSAYDALTPGTPGTVTRWNQAPGLVTAVGWNGGGFKLAPAVARHAATELLTAASR